MAKYIDVGARFASFPGGYRAVGTTERRLALCRIERVVGASGVFWHAGVLISSEAPSSLVWSFPMMLC